MPSPSPHTPTPIPTLSPTPTPSPSQVTLSPTLTPSPIYGNFKEKLDIIAAIFAIIAAIITVVELIWYRQKKISGISLLIPPLLLAFLAFLVFGSILLIIEIIKMALLGIIAISTVVIAIIAYLYACHPKPIVLAYLRHKPLGIYVENVGRGIAKNGKIKVCSLGGDVVYKDEFERLYMSQRYEYPTDKNLDVVKLIINEKIQFIVKIDYEDEWGKSIPYKEKISILQEFI